MKSTTAQQAPIPDTLRPYRIWDAKRKVWCVGRYFAHERNAHNAALLIARWAKIDEALEVIDVRTMRLIGQYIRREKSVAFIAGRISND